MGEKDITEKTLEAYNDVFADIINVLLFDGREIVTEDSLTDAAPTSQYKMDGKIHEQERDVAKYWKNGQIRIALYGFENQTTVDEDMPIRCFPYDGAAYRDQLNQDENVVDEITGKTHKTKKVRYPVITLVLYFGLKHWHKPKNLRGLLHIPKDLEPYVNDYKINLYEIAWLTPETVKKFKSDFKIVADYFVQLRMNNDYEPSKEKMRHVNEILKLMAVLTGDYRFEDVANEQAERKVSNMCEAIEKGVRLGLEKARMEGIMQATSQMVLKMLKKSKDLTEIAELSDWTVEHVREFAKENGISIKA